jgi:hypothetical protein
MSDEFQIIEEYSFLELPKSRILDLLARGAKVYQICENPACEKCNEYQAIVDPGEIMTYCLRCARKVLKYGVEKK